MNVQDILSTNLLDFGDYKLDVRHLVGLLLIIIVARIVIWIIRRVFDRRINRDQMDAGRGLAMYQILRYVVIIAAILLSLDTVGIKITLLLAGSAALLVGVGLGLQQTFNDLISGVILLFEGSIAIGDIVEVNEFVARVKKIHLRTSEVETRDGITILIPNSKLTNDNVINWSHNRKVTRFVLKVGVAYGSDTKLVKNVLELAALEHADVVKEPTPSARFVDFADSSLNFELLFWSPSMFQIEQVKSDLRFLIDQKFRENGVTIPFPQRDLHLKTSDISLK